MKLAAALLLSAAAVSPALADEAHSPYHPPPYASGPPATEQTAIGQRGQALPMQPGRQLRIDTDEGTWLSPDISPDGRTIVFELLGDIYAIPATGGEARPILTGMSFDSQPVFSPDGQSIAFISDRSGAENIWIADIDGKNLRQVSLRDDNSVFTSPAWSADGRSLTVSNYRPDLDGFELWHFDAASGEGRLMMPIKATPDQASDQWSSVLGAAPSADGKFLYFARRVGGSPHGKLPEWTIVRRDLATGAERVMVSAPRSPRPDLVLGTAFRPALTPDGKRLVYGARDRGKTGLRLLDVETGDDRWLAFPVQQDESEASGWRDILPRHVVTPDGKALIANIGGKLSRIDLASGVTSNIPFQVRGQIDIGPSTRQAIREETGPVEARLIQNPVQSPDGRRLAFSALGTIYLMPLGAPDKPLPLTQGFQPSWSPDGKTLAFVRWTAREGGAVWTVAANGGTPVRVTETGAYYTAPTFTPDGRQLLTTRSSNAVRMHSYMEYGALRQAELVALPLQGGPARVITVGNMGGTPHFGSSPDTVLLSFADGINAVKLDGSGQRSLFNVTGPGWYFAEGRASADDIRISPDGRHALIQIVQQLYLIAVPPPGQTVDLATPGIVQRKLTDVGADFYGWADGGLTITWAIGSTFYRQALDSGAPKAVRAVVALPRQRPSGSMVLRGATAITMRGDEVIADADIVITGDRITAVGKRGTIALPPDAALRDVAGKWIVPGLIDTHDHLADIRRGVLDFESWGPLANLAYGVTTAFDPSTLSIDMLAYQDAIDAGLMVGSRIRSTGPAIFSFNEFRSQAEVEAVLRRYRDHYRVGNIKMYRTGNRRIRQWIAIAARKLGLQPTAEGALSMKLDMSQIIDGYAGTEHALTATPLYKDMVSLVAGSGVGYTATLQITNGGPEGQDWFIVRDRPSHDAKLNRFSPRFIVDMKTRTRMYRDLDEYLFPQVAAGTAQIQRAGGLIGIGSHGEMPGLGVHWEMQAHVMGGMTPAEALQAGTIGSAAAIGRQSDMGSLEPGKLADLIVLDRDPLADIANARAINMVMLAGRLRDSSTMDEIWPEQRPLSRRWYCDDRPPGAADPCSINAEGKSE